VRLCKEPTRKLSIANADCVSPFSGMMPSWGTDGSVDSELGIGPRVFGSIPGPGELLPISVPDVKGITLFMGHIVRAERGLLMHPWQHGACGRFSRPVSVYS